MNVIKIDSTYSNSDEINRILHTTNLAAVSRGKSKSNNPEKRYKELLVEASGKKPSRPLEFLPIILKYTILKEYVYIKIIDNKFMLHFIDFVKYFGGNLGFSKRIGENNYILYTNMRAVLNSGIPYDLVPFMKEGEEKEYKKFKAFKVESPMFVWAQLMTHTALSKESQSDRICENTKYWIPDDFMDKYKEIAENTKLKEIIEKNDDGDDIFKIMIDKLSQTEIQSILIRMGYKREIWSRAPYYFKYKEMVVTGWGDDVTENTFLNLFLERNVLPDTWKTWAQKETTEICKEIFKLCK